ncbi:MAG: ABC transporter permease [Woeseiaceae bacterium]
MKQILFIAWSDARFQLRQGSTLLWVFVMPPIFFYFIGTVTGGFSSGFGGGSATPIVVVAESPGFLQEQISLRLRENDFAPVWVTSVADSAGEEAPTRTLTFAAKLSEKIKAGEQVSVSFDTKASALSREFEIIRIQRSVLTALADIVAADATNDGALTATELIALNAKPRIWNLDVSSAGNRQIIPTGFEQAIPGILVMFTLLVLLTSGATMLVIERKQGLLRRLASTPISRREVVSGKWGGRMVLAILQVTVALVIGTFLFKMNWGPDLAMVILILAAWAGFCASAGLLLGSIASTEGQAAGLGVLAANALAALGGCWWPIEVTPEWMQTLQKFMPTGWTMDALHKLISFQSGAAAALPQLVIIIAATLVVATLAVNRFKYV